MRHAPTAFPRLRRAVVLASLALLSLWCVARSPVAAAVARPTSALARPTAVALPARWVVRQLEGARTPAPSAPAREVPAAATRPGEADDHSSALAPIVLGLVLTGIASYKHRGLPRGH